MRYFVLATFFSLRHRLVLTLRGTSVTVKVETRALGRVLYEQTVADATGAGFDALTASVASAFGTFPDLASTGTFFDPEGEGADEAYTAARLRVALDRVPG